MFILKRFFLLFINLLGISFIIFAIIFMIPGDPVQLLVGEYAPKEVVKSIKRELNLDKPFIFQYKAYLFKILKLDFGKSIYTKTDISKEIKEKLVITAKLTFTAIFIAILIGISSGILTAIYNDSFFSKLNSILIIFTMSTPIFWFALILLYILSYKLNIFPISYDSSLGIFNFILPGFVLGIRSAALISEVTKNSLLEVLKEQYIVTAYAKGLSKIKVIFKHALKNAILPIITLIGLEFASFLNGSVVTETIFQIPGIGKYAVDGIFKRDYPVVLAVVIVGSFIYIMVNLIVDILYYLINPKLKSNAS